MVLESTMICLDNSDFMINTDFLPTRMQAQYEAASLFVKTKLRENPENDVGLIALSDGEVLMPLTNDPHKILAKLLNIKPRGTIKLLSGIKTAQLALRNRQNKNGKMRILAFVGSPIEEIGKDLSNAAKQLRNENVSMDVVNFGEVDINMDVLRECLFNLNGRLESNANIMIPVEPGYDLSDAVRTILNRDLDPDAPFQNLNSDIFDDAFEEDSDLYLALQMSLKDFNKQHRAHNDFAADSFEERDQIECAMNMSSEIEDNSSLMFLEYSLQDLSTPTEEDKDEDDGKQDQACALDKDVKK